ncbi:MAG TPA: ATP-binding protein, partial [Albitalea sp.]|nr:ATP-binding protein [Albitalea sp.]
APRARPMGTQMDLVAKRRDGSEVMVEIALSPLHDQGLPYVVAAVRGIGAYPRVRQALQRARYSELLTVFGRLAVDTRDPGRLIEQAPRTAVEAMQVPAAMVYLLEADNLRFRVASGLGLLPEQALGAFVANTPDTLPGFVVAKGEPFIIANGAQTDGFTIAPFYVEAGLVNALAVPLSDRGRPIGVLAARSRAEQAFGPGEVQFLESLGSLLATSLQRAHSDEALLHSQRLESVGQLTGGIAHDFNNLLTVISGNLQIVEEAAPVAQDPALRQMIRAATRAAARAADLTGKLLAFSRRQVLQPAAIDVGQLLQSLADMLRRTLDQRILIEVDLAAGCPQCLADRAQLESALLNISINARDAMPEGGRLAFKAWPVRELPHAARANEQSGTSPGYVAIAVTDSGTGMPEAIKERAFEPFFTTKEAGRGTGLGLSSVYGFATQSQGAVSLESQVGQGTTITLFLPSRQAREATDERLVDAASIPHGLRVLLVEDEAEVRAVVENFLMALGCTPTACVTAEQALALLVAAGERAPFDLVLTDIALGPGMRGTELAREAALRWPQMAVLLMSGFSSDLIAPTAWPLLRKPFSQGELAHRIATLLR